MCTGKNMIVHLIYVLLVVNVTVCMAEAPARAGIKMTHKQLNTITNHWKSHPESSKYDIQNTIDLILKAQASPQFRWNPQWGDYLEYHRVRGHVPNDKWLDYLLGAIRWKPRFLACNQNGLCSIDLLEYPYRVDPKVPAFQSSMRLGNRIWFDADGRIMRDVQKTSYILGVAIFDGQETGEMLLLGCGNERPQKKRASIQGKKIQRDYIPRPYGLQRHGVCCWLPEGKMIEDYIGGKVVLSMAIEMKETAGGKVNTYTRFISYEIHINRDSGVGVSANDGQDKKDSNESEESEK